MLGLETAFALTLGESGLDLPEVLAVLSWRPAAIAGIADRHGAVVAPGAPANLCVVDPDETWTVSGVAMASRSHNTPYEGRTLRGRVRHTIRAGEPVVIDGEAQR
jgi:dihydroorotase